MERLSVYGASEIEAHTNARAGELKIGQKAQFISNLDEINRSKASYVLLGIPEDIGVRANHGIAGAATAWLPALKAILNIQSTPFFDGAELLVLGHFTFDEVANLENTQLQQKVEEIDEAVYIVIQQIVAAGKTPIIIGGGHNNAYPIIKGTSLSLQKPIDVINIDAHADLRPTTGRHSGNGFSYAIKDGYLNRYGIFGLHQNYNSQAILDTLAANQHIYPVFFDDLLKRDEPISTSWTNLLMKTGSLTGLELDLDSIENVLASAASPTGFRLNEIRKLILTSTKRFVYFHVCEGAVTLSDGRQDQTAPKAIAYLISDFIKAQSSIKK